MYKYFHIDLAFTLLSANSTKWSNTLQQFVGCLNVFQYSVGLALKGLNIEIRVYSRHIVYFFLF